MKKDSIEANPTSNENTPTTIIGYEAVVEEVDAIPETPIVTDPASAPEAVVEIVAQEQRPGERREIVKSATLVSLGNLGSSVMGMVRQIVVASAGPVISGSFLGALTPAQTFYDFLVNGSVSGALIPTFNDYAAPEKRDELRRIVFSIVNLLILITLLAGIAFLFVTPWLFSTFLAGGYGAGSKDLTIQFAGIIFFSLVALAPFSVLLAALYALKEFGWPAFATAAYHLGIVLGAIIGGLLGSFYFKGYGMAIGVLLGAGGEILLLIPGMRKQRFGYMFVLDLKHPALQRVLKLYAPVAGSFLVSMFLVFLDQALASSAHCALYVANPQNCGEANFSAMRFATTLIQFPQGLVGIALSFAVLPTLTAHARENNLERFKETLLLGCRLGFLLMIPAAAGLIVLQTPIILALFKHGDFSGQETILTSLALQNYAYQLPFIAMDQILIAAFYARKNTIIPVVVQFVAILGYLAVALPFSQNFGVPALALANTVQNSLHALVLLVILRATMGSLGIRKTLPTVLKILLATVAMMAVAWGLQVVLSDLAIFSLDHLLGRLLTLAIAGGLATAVYFGCVLLLKVEEVRLLKGAVLAKLGKK